MTETTPKPREYPILMTGPMVRAVLEGRKTVTRRVAKPQPHPGIYRFIDLSEYSRPGHGPFKPTWGSDDPEYVFPSTEETVKHNACIRCPYGAPGDRLWVKEKAKLNSVHGRDVNGEWVDGLSLGFGAGYPYAQTYQRKDGGPYREFERWVPSLFMPRWASRLLLEVVSVRVERVQEITEEEAVAEGVELREPGLWRAYGEKNPLAGCLSARGSFACLWDTINLKRGYGWDTNPYVWVIEFRRVEGDA